MGLANVPANVRRRRRTVKHTLAVCAPSALMAFTIVAQTHARPAPRIVRLVIKATTAIMIVSQIGLERSVTLVLRTILKPLMASALAALTSAALEKLSPVDVHELEH